MSVPPELIQNAIQAAERGQRALALRLFLAVVERDPYQRQAGVYLSELVEDPQDRPIALENALALRPGDPDLAALRSALLLAHPSLSKDEPSPAINEQAGAGAVFQQALRLLSACKREARAGFWRKSWRAYE